MKHLYSIVLALGLFVHLPTFADTHLDNDKLMSKAQPNDMLVMQLKHPDGTKAKVLIKRKDALKFHKTKGVEALDVFFPLDGGRPEDVSTQKN
jgi:hypothetical protein